MNTIDEILTRVRELQLRKTALIARSYIPTPDAPWHELERDNADLSRTALPILATRVEELQARIDRLEALRAEMAQCAEWSLAADDPHDWRKGLLIVRDRCACPSAPAPNSEGEAR